LREKVWGFVMADGNGAFMLAPGMKPSPFFYPMSLPPIAFVRRSLFHEVFLVWVRTHSFQLLFNAIVPAWFVWWMDNIAEGRAWANVKTLNFTAALRVYQPGLLPNFSIFSAADLIARATTLRYLTLTISSLSVTHFDSQTGYFTRIKPIDEILSTLNFTDILRCERLQTLTLCCCPTWKGNRCLEAEDLGCRPHDVFVPLCRWFVRNFEEQGRKVKVQGKLDRRGKKWSEEPDDKWSI
jgi:hypothetical protein